MSQLLTPFRSVTGDGTVLPTFTVLRPFFYRGSMRQAGEAFADPDLPNRVRQLYTQRKIGLVMAPVAAAAPIQVPAAVEPSATSALAALPAPSPKRGWKGRLKPQQADHLQPLD